MGRVMRAGDVKGRLNEEGEERGIQCHDSGGMLQSWPGFLERPSQRFPSRSPFYPCVGPWGLPRKYAYWQPKVAEGKPLVQDSLTIELCEQVNEKFGQDKRGNLPSAVGVCGRPILRTIEAFCSCRCASLIISKETPRLGVGAVDVRPIDGDLQNCTVLSVKGLAVCGEQRRG